MTESVEYKLQCMIPDLTALLERGYFTKEELKIVLEKRTQFEYSLKSDYRSVEDFYKYIQYEQKLEELRSLRAVRFPKEGLVHGQNMELCDYCIVKHIHSIFTQATLAFKSDRQLWKQWFAFCKSSSSPQRMSKALTAALRLNPHVTEFWIIAAHWQLDEIQNSNLARSIMQQGIRNCPSSKELWIQYFKIELKIAQQLLKRRELLELESSVSESWDNLLNGSTAFRVFQEAVNKHPTDLKFMNGFLDASSEFSFSAQFKLEAWIFETIQKTFSERPEVWDMEARRLFAQKAKDNISEAIENALEVYFKGISQFVDTDLYSSCLLFLVDVYEGLEVEEQQTCLHSGLCEQMKTVLKEAFQDGLVSEKAIVAVCQICRKQNQDQELKDILIRATEHFPKSVAIFQEHIYQIENTALNFSKDQLIEQCLIVLKRFQGSLSFQLWSQVIDLSCSFNLSLSMLKSLYCQLATSVSDHTEKAIFGAITQHFFQCLKGHESDQTAEDLAKELLSVPFLDVDSYMAIIDMYTTKKTEIPKLPQQKRIRDLFEKAILIYGDKESKVWIKYIEFEHSLGNKRIGSIFQRARNSGLSDIRPIETCIKQLC